MRPEDLSTIESWGKTREPVWGPFQRFQPDHIPALRDAYDKGRLLSRDSGFLIVETVGGERPIGFVRYTLRVPDSDFPYPEIGLGISDVSARGKGLGREALGLLVGYLFSGYFAPRIAAFTDVENVPARRLLQRLILPQGAPT